MTVEFKPKHPGGRPRTVSPSPEECVLLGEEMVKWVEEHKPTHLSEWFSIEKMITWKIWKNLCDMPEFSPYYEQALSIVAREIRKKGVLDAGVAQRFLNLYHRDLKQEDISMMKIEAEINRAKELEGTDEQRNALHILMGWVSSQQIKSIESTSKPSKDQN